jgi:glycosyltransferase involved in cell wall biosynthesis
MAEHSDLEFRVFYLWDFGIRPQNDPKFGTAFAWDTDLLSGYEHVFVPNDSSSPGTESFWGLNNPLLVRRLKEWSPKAILLFGYKYMTHLKTIWWASHNNIPVIFRGDSHLIGRNMGPVKGLLLRKLFSRFSAFVYVGKANQDYFRRLGVPDRKLFFSPHSVDASVFDPSKSGARECAESLRKELNIPPQAKVLLFAGKFQPSKQPYELLESFLSLQMDNVYALFVGDGQESERMKKRAQREPSVRFLPFSNQSLMPSRYLAADVFALPSKGYYETWGLAVNEAMHMGLPCLVSDRVGCQQDLVSDGITGWVFASEDMVALKNKLKDALGRDLTPFRQAVQKRILNYTYRQTTEGLLSAYRSVSREP